MPAIVLADNRYPGRGIAVGRSPDGRSLVHVYWLTGRSVSSRNRLIRREKDGSLRTELIDTAAVVDPALLVYRAMVRDGLLHITTNGDHTERLLQQLPAGRGLSSILEEITFEPDPPLYTPRIMAVSDLESSLLVCFAIAKSLTGQADFVQHHLFTYTDLPAGSGLCITTYADDGDPPPSFAGEPFPVRVANSPDETVAAFWADLLGDNLVSVAAKHVDMDTGAFAVAVRNRNEAS